MINQALGEYGIKEVQGKEANNPRIIEYFAAIGQIWVKTDETAWCSAFVNYIAKQAGYEYTGKLNARSWLDAGQPVLIPKIGDVTILWRVDKKDWRGHVGFYINEDDTHIYLLGGNQSNSVCIKPYPKERLLGFRRLKKL
jgi:uncharacterized protein (TIGR02594 family)